MVSLPFCRSHLSIPGTIDIIHVTWIGNVTPAAIYVSYTVYVKNFVAGVFNFVVLWMMKIHEFFHEKHEIYYTFILTSRVQCTLTISCTCARFT